MSDRFTSKFDIDEFNAQMKAQEDAEARIRQIVPDGAIDGDPWEDAPASDMVYDSDINKWVPKAFKEGKRQMIKEEIQRILDATPNLKNPGYSISGKKLSEFESDSVSLNTLESSATETDNSTVQQENQCTAIPDKSVHHLSDKPNKESKTKRSSANTRRKKPEQPSTMPPIIEPENAEVVPVKMFVSESQSEAVEQSKKTRRSARMDEADFDILAGKFIYPTDLAEKKPLFFPTDIRESLKLVARLIPGGKVSPSHIAIHIIRAWLDENRDLLNRMLSSQKLSI